jgi:HAD superfamily hydrolase (TIGR01509 family)
MPAALWDMDGTLIDSEDYHWRAWRDTMAREGVPITHEHFLATFGQRNDAILPHWLGAGATPERIRQIGDAKEELYRDLLRNGGIAPLPGAAEWVARLHEQGWRQAIASSAPRLNVEAILETLKLPFDVIIAAEDVRHGKPDPEVFLTAAARLGVPPPQCVVVEDAAAGIEAARRGAMRSIGVSRKSELPADLFAPSLADLPADAFTRLVTGSPASPVPARSPRTMP